MAFPTVREKCKELRIELDKALAVVGAKLGMSIQAAGSMTYNETTISVKITANLPNKAGNVESLEAKDFKTNAWKWGLKEADLGRMFTSGGQTYTITGAKPRSGRYPILAQRQDGKTFKFPAEQIRAQLHSAASAAEQVRVELHQQAAAI